MAGDTVERTLRGRLELRNAREHRRVERLFRAAQEARNAIIEDFRPARAWNLRELRRQRRRDPAWQPGADDWFDWEGPVTPRQAGKLARYSSQAVRNRAVTRLRNAGKMPLASEYTVALARGEASRVARGVQKGGRKPLRYRGWRGRGSVEWDRLCGLVFARGSRRHGKLRGKDTGSLRFRLYEDQPEGAEIRSMRLVRTRRGQRGVGPSVYEVHFTVREAGCDLSQVPLRQVVGVDAGGRATATDDVGAVTVLSVAEDAAGEGRLQRRLSRCRKGSGGRRKARARLERHRAKTALAKRQLCRKKASRMVRPGRCVVVEELDHAGMRRRGRGKRGMNRSMKNGSPGMFRKALEEIAARRRGAAVAGVNAAYTSRQCVRCGSRDTELDRTHVSCVACGAREDRDRAAAGNLVLVLLAGLCLAGAPAKSGGVPSPGGVAGAAVRGDSILVDGVSACSLPESLGRRLLSRALARWGEHAPGLPKMRAGNLNLWVNSVSFYG